MYVKKRPRRIGEKQVRVTDVQSLQNVHVLRQFAKEREAQLRRTTIIEGPIRTWPVRRWLGEELARLGAWVGSDPSLRPAREGLR